MARIEVTRHVAADSASVALLLAEPASEREPDNGITVAAPRRNGIGFAATVEVFDALGRAVVGQVTVEPATDAGCEVRLVLAAPDNVSARGVERAGAAFLSELAARARSRSYAA